MKKLQGYWLTPVDHHMATSDLGFQLVGQPGKRNILKKMACPLCTHQLRLVAIARRSPYLPLQRFESILLYMCQKCAAKSDGFPYTNGFVARFATTEQLNDVLNHYEYHLQQPVYFRVEPTQEPAKSQEFKSWRTGKLRAKLGGRQISIQPELTSPKCPRCSGNFVFVLSLPQAWAPRKLNFGGGMGYLFACTAECKEDSAFFYWDCS